MTVKINENQEALSKLKERLDEIELEQSDGANSYTLEELDNALKKIIDNPMS